LKVKQRQKEEAMHIENTQKGWLQKRDEMLKAVFCIWWRAEEEREEKKKDIENQSSDGYSQDFYMHCAA
jgi:hypothetical protein